MVKIITKSSLLSVFITCLFSTSVMAQCVDDGKGNYACSGGNGSLSFMAQDSNDLNSIHLSLEEDSIIVSDNSQSVISYSGANFTLQSAENVEIKGGGINISTSDYTNSTINLDLQGHINLANSWDNGISIAAGSHSNIRIDNQADISKTDNNMSMGGGFSYFLIVIAILWLIILAILM